MPSQITKIKIKFTLIFLCFSISYTTCESKTIAVSEFKNKTFFHIKEFKNTGQDISGRILSEYICNDLRINTDFKILEPSRVFENVTMPLSISHNKIITPQAISAIYKNLKSDYVLFGEIEEIKFRKKFFLLSQKIVANVRISTYLINTLTGSIDLYDNAIISCGENISIVNYKKNITLNLIKETLKKYSNIISLKIKIKLEEKPIYLTQAQVTSPFIFYNEGIASYNAGNYEQAILSFEKFIEKDGQNIFVEDAKRYIENSKVKLDEIAKSKEIKIRNKIEQKEKGEIDWAKDRISAIGENIIQDDIKDVSTKQEVARKSAIFDSYKNLLNMVYAITVNGKTIKDLCNANPRLEEEVNKIISNARIIRERITKNNLYEITREISISDLQKIFPDIYIEK